MRHARPNIAPKTITSRQALALILSCSAAALLAPCANAAPGSPARLGATEPAKRLTLAFALPSRDPAGAKDFVTHVTTPGDPLYHHYLSPEEYAARYGASPQAYEALVAWAKAQGLQIGERYTARTILPVSAPASVMAKALGVTFSNYRLAATGRTFYAADTEAHLPDAVARLTDGVIGLSSAAHFVPHVIAVPAGTKTMASGHGPGGAYDAADLRQIYSIPAQGFANHPQTLAVFEQGGFDPADVTKYTNANHLPQVAVQARNVNRSGTGIDDPNVELEAVLDIDMIVAINPAASQILVYEDGSDAFQVALVDAFSAMASDNVARTISISYGQDEALQGPRAIKAENTILTQMAAQGQAVFASAGDSGAYGNQSRPLNVSDPASQPFVTAVGGTTLFTGQNESYITEEAWNDLGAGYGATGGGISKVWPIPPYQLVSGQSVAVQNRGSATLRNVPDVAAIGNPLTGVAIYSALNGGWRIVGGTSVSAPVWAGFYSLVNAATEGLGLGSAGFANPGLYSLYANPAFLYPHFHDVSDGSNGFIGASKPGFSAGYGFDDVSGVGTMNGSATLLNLAIYPTRSNAKPPPVARNLAAELTPTTAKLSWLGADVDTGFLVLAANYNTGATSAAIAQTSNAVTLTGLTPNTTYYYYIVAISPGGTSESEFDIFTTPKTGS